MFSFIIVRVLKRIINIHSFIPQSLLNLRLCSFCFLLKLLNTNTNVILHWACNFGLFSLDVSLKWFIISYISFYSSFCSNIDSKSSNNTLINIIEILNKFKIFKYHKIRKFSNNIDLRKLDVDVTTKFCIRCYLYMK